MAMLRDDRHLVRILRELRAEQAQNRTDLQRLWKLAERWVRHPSPIPSPQEPGSSS